MSVARSSGLFRKDGNLDFNAKFSNSENTIGAATLGSLL
jgi:hypothetical protein